MGSGRPSAVRTFLDHGLHLCHEFRIGPCGLQVADGAPEEADWDHGEPEAADDHQGRIDVGSGCGEARAADQQHDNATDRDDRAARDGREPSGRLGLDQGPAAGHPQEHAPRDQAPQRAEDAVCQQRDSGDIGRVMCGIGQAYRGLGR